MSHWEKIRHEASKLRLEVCSVNGIDSNAAVPAEEFTSLALNHLDLSLSPEHPDSANLHGSLAVLEDDVVFFNNTLEGGFRHYCIAHEAGHRVLHRFEAVCKRDDIEDIEAEEEVPTAKGRVIGYGPHERKEREANLFALELLLPCESLRAAFVNDGQNALQIAETTGMPVSYVVRQLMRALLIPEIESGGGIKDDAEKFELNESQRGAVETRECPVLISAGPGTGKTETLIRRIVHLLDKGTDPQRILALTFSNKATEEMRERIAEARPSDAAKIPIMTFHSFGFNLLRRYWKEAGINKDSGLLDPTDALLMLEGHLAELKLVHYLQLVEPLRNLAEVLTAVARAKDELCTPDGYRKHAESMLRAAEEEDDILEAEKALETARVYEYYQRLMDDGKLLDFGDLILRPVRLLEGNDTVRREVCGSYDHILVDEFQDVNRASGVLLRLVAGSGSGLWSVGDLRQSIYRWRGASPANIRRFHEEYEGAQTLSLETNYRSLEPIVRTFGEFGKGMKAHEPFNEWEVFRGGGVEDSVTYDIGDQFDTEAARIAERILENRAGGLPFKEQAVICRSHKQLADLASALSLRGIPLFYLGNLFERPEVRDLLSLLELASASHGHALVRVGAFPDYGMSLLDAICVVNLAKKRQLAFGDIDARDKELDLEGQSREGFGLLKDHLVHEPKTSAYRFLTEYLFSKSAFLRPLLKDDSISSRQKLIAIYQFLGFAGSLQGRFASSEHPIAEFLRYVKRLALFREQKNLAEIPAAAGGLDAVRLLTVHGAKGLEFGAVYLPYLAAGKFPATRRGETCPTPPGLRASDGDDHDEEEECLFFVAASRARDRLHFSRSTHYGERASKPSPFLEAIDSVLPEPSVMTGGEKREEEVHIPPEAYARTEFYAAELDRYLNCNRQYFYQTEMGLKSGDDRSAYQKFHGVVFDTLTEIQNTGTDQEAAGESAENVFDRLWAETDLHEHPYAGLYREKALEILKTAIARLGGTQGVKSRPTLRAPLGNGGVKVSPSLLEIIDRGGSKEVIARQIKTGRAPAKPEAKNVDAVLLQALRLEYPDGAVSLRKVYLSDDEEQEMKITDLIIGNRIGKYEGAIDAINRREFDPSPDDHKCPTCAYYFMCSGKEN